MIGKIYILIAAYLLFINIVALILFAADKKKAAENKWRIAEKVLFLSAILGGSIGAIAGMYLFRHKTKHWYFVVGMPLILLLQISAAILILRHFGS